MNRYVVFGRLQQSSGRSKQIKSRRFCKPSLVNAAAVAKEDITITASETEKWLPGYSGMDQAGSISKFGSGGSLCSSSLGSLDSVCDASISSSLLSVLEESS